MSATVQPLDRLGRWDGSAWVPVATGSVIEPRVHILTHGWGPGMRPTVKAHDGFLRVWDEAAETQDGRRFDRWFGPLATAILDDDPDVPRDGVHNFFTVGSALSIKPV